MSSISRSSLFLTAVTIIIIVFAMIIITKVEMETKPSTSSSDMIITVGPVWNNNTWTCTSDNDFLVHGALRGLNGSQITISISGVGTQSLYQLTPGHLESFSVGAPQNQTITIIGTGAVTGFLTLQTKAGSTASCTQ